MENNYGGDFGRDWQAAHRGGQHKAGEHPDRCGLCLIDRLEDMTDSLGEVIRNGDLGLADLLPEGSRRDTVRNATAMIDGAHSNLMRLAAQVHEEMAR